jgi:glycosyltransferase involved in cell wall biosynthesis
MSRPDISVVVPVYNGAPTIAALIESLIAQHLPAASFEIIVVDNRSTDDTAAVVGRYPVRLLRERSEQSSYAARNLGLRAAQGAIVAFTDADCIAAPGWLAALCRPFERPAVGASAGAIVAAPAATLVQRYCARERWYELATTQRPFFAAKTRGERLCRRVPGLDYRARLPLPALANPPTANVAYRRAVFDQIGPFEPRLRSGGDLDLAWRMQLQTSWQIELAPDAVVEHQHRRDLRGLLQLNAKNGWGYAMLARRYAAPAPSIGPRLAGEAIVLSALLLPRQLARLAGRLAARSGDRLDRIEPLLTLLGSLAYQWGKARGAVERPAPANLALADPRGLGQPGRQGA